MNTGSAHKPVDVVIVGSGPVGAAIARTITDEAPDARVLLVEVGPRLTHQVGQHLGNIPDPADQADARHRAQGPYTQRVDQDPLFSERARALEPGADPMLLERPGLFRIGERSRIDGEDGLPAAAMTSAVGGMGILWTASCPRPSGSERIPFIPAHELESAFERADALLRVDHQLNAAAPVNRLVRQRLSAVYDGAGDRPVQPLPLAVRVENGRAVWSGIDVILGDMLELPQVELRDETLARRVVMEGGDAVGVELEDRRTGERYVQPARTVVVAADAYRTPQLLFASGVTPEALGRYINDHFQMLAAVRLRAEDDQASIGADDAAAAWLPIGGTWVPFVDTIRPYHGQILQVGASPAQLANGGVEQMKDIVAMSWYSPKELHATDRIEFSEVDVDSYGMPAITVHYRVTDADRASLDGMRQAMIRGADALGELLHPGPLLMPGGVSMHVQGATRMGEHDDGTSVCDPVGRVWGTSNLYVGGNNVIPTATAANPTITSVALGVRTGRAIASEFRVR
ncbi:GMC oxidoreductase [Actinoplanes sp. NPDC049265]|uniref:GMC oxidoreductase n=1 Tax=Actinoplanes sp. NPDC049265 TaxID=3363902 RepID=UPI003722510D